MIRRQIIFSGYLILCSILISAQNEDYVVPSPRDFSKNPSKTAAFLELGGNAGLYSINVDRIYMYEEHLKLSARFGFAPHFNGIYIEQIYILENNFIFLKNPHHLELGLGGTLQRRFNELPGSTDSYFWENIFFGVGRIGYRYQKREDGFFLRIGFTPAIISNDALGFHADYFQGWAGISMGVNF